MTTTDDRTPDTREVRAMYDAGSNLYRETPEQHYLGHPAPDYGAEFDRWLAAHDARVRREAKAEGWDEGYLDRSPYGGRARSRADNPYHTSEKESRHDD